MDSNQKYTIESLLREARRPVSSRDRFDKCFDALDIWLGEISGKTNVTERLKFCYEEPNHLRDIWLRDLPRPTNRESLKNISERLSLEPTSDVRFNLIRDPKSLKENLKFIGNLRRLKHKGYPGVESVLSHAGEILLNWLRLAH